MPAGEQLIQHIQQRKSKSSGRCHTQHEGQDGAKHGHPQHSEHGEVQHKRCMTDLGLSGQTSARLL